MNVNSLLSVLLFFLLIAFASANVNVEWTWLSGLKIGPQRGNYSSEDSLPCARVAHCMWVTSKGDIYIFGGRYISASDNEPIEVLNDLWLYNTTSDTWELKHGSSAISPLGNYPPTRGQRLTTNTPGGRWESGCWTDDSDNLWLFGGYGVSNVTIKGNLNDVWMYDTTDNVWVWVSGSKARNSQGGLVRYGEYSVNNFPGARWGAYAQHTGSGAVMFGGLSRTLSSTTVPGSTADLWEFNSNLLLWKLISGPYERNQYGLYGPCCEFQCNRPGSVYGNYVWYDDVTHKLYIFGGTGQTDTTNGRRNDFWMFDRNTEVWTLLGGSPNVSVNPTSNYPGSRILGSSFSDADGNLWLYAGNGDASSFYVSLNDLWMYNLTSGNWIFVKGNSTGVGVASYGTKGVGSPSNIPGPRYGQRTVRFENKMYMFGGYGYDESGARVGLGDLWSLQLPDPVAKRQSRSVRKQEKPIVAQDVDNEYQSRDVTDNVTIDWSWTWVTGSKNTNGNYGTMGVPSPSNEPPSRSNGGMWVQSNNTVYIFGGFLRFTGFSDVYANDLWKYENDMWVWVHGSNVTDLYGNYGDLRNGTKDTTPGARREVATFTDSHQRLWLFGGVGFGSNPNFGKLNDLWMFDGAIWTWMSGTGNTGDTNSFGVVGVESVSNILSGRHLTVAFYDRRRSETTAHIFGGYGFPFSTGIEGTAGDLWQYNITSNAWTYLGGHAVVAQVAIFGPDTSRCLVPSTRFAQTGAVGSNGEYYMYGGQSLNNKGYGLSNDLWVYNEQNHDWHLLFGSSVERDLQTTYGPNEGVWDINNVPGGRSYGSSWTDNEGHFYLFGGSTTSKDASNVLWVFNTTTKMWAYLGGDRNLTYSPVENSGNVGQNGSYPGVRRGHMSASNDRNQIFMFGGSFLNGASTREFYNDLWRLDIQPVIPLIINTTTGSTGETTGTSTGTESSTSTGGSVSTTGSQSTGNPTTTSPGVTTNGDGTTEQSDIVDSNNYSSDEAAVIVGSVVGAVGGCCFIILLLVILRKVLLSKQQKKEDQTKTDVEMNKGPTKPTIVTIETNIISPGTTSTEDVNDIPTNKQEVGEAELPICENVEIVKLIGSGNFGSVYTGNWNGTRVALKRITNAADNKSKLAFMKEISLLCKLRHPNVVSFLGVYDNKNGELYMVMEYLKSGSLLSLLHSHNNRYTLYELVSFMCSVTKGMVYLSTQNPPVIHRDLSTRNILVTKAYHKYLCKVTDFGLAKMVSEYISSDAQVPIRWSSPEVINRGTITTKSDVYSLGVVMWEILEYGMTPYISLSTKDAALSIINGVYLEKPYNCPDDLYEIMMVCWKRDPADRPTFLEVLKLLKKFKKEVKAMAATQPIKGSDKLQAKINPTTPENLYTKIDADTLSNGSTTSSPYGSTEGVVLANQNQNHYGSNEMLPDSAVINNDNNNNNNNNSNYGSSELPTGME